MIFVGVLIFGLYSYLNIPIDFFPKLDPPFISVFTYYHGANAIDVEQNITRKLENGFGSLSNLKKITSTSKENISVITLEFDWGANLDEATNEVRNAIGMVERSLPDEVETPSIFKMSSSLIPVIMYTISSNESYPAIKDILDTRVVQPLNRIEGVGNTIVVGAPVRAVMVDVDPRKIEAYNITVEQISSILAANNINLPSGSLEMGNVDIPLRLQGEFPNSNIIGDLVVSNYAGKTVYLKDIATVRDTLKYIKSFETANGKKTVSLMIQKQSDANTVSLSNKVKERMAQIEKNLPDDIKIHTLFDSSEFTKNAIDNLSETLLFGLLFVILVVLFFIGRWRATLIVAITIPISLVAGFIYMFLANDSLNIITLSSLAIAIGLVVDDAIVVLENITKKLDRGGFAKESAIYGTSEVFTAVIASTLTIAAVFLPLTLLGGMTGILFKPLGFVVSITITMSTIISLTLTPVLASKMLKATSPARRGPAGHLYWISQGVLEKMDNFYEKTLTFVVGHRWLVIVLATIIFASSMMLTVMLGSEFMPASDNSRISVQLRLAQGINLAETIKTAKQVDSMLRHKYPEIEILYTSAGAGDENNLSAVFNETGNYIISYTMKMQPVEKRQRSIFEIADLMRDDIEQLPEIEKFYVDPGDSRSNNMGSGGGNVLQVNIYGNDFGQTSLVAEKISQTLKQIKGAKDIIISRDPEIAEIQLVLDHEKMSSFGLNTATVATVVRNRINGITATKYKEDGNEYDVIVRYDQKYRQSTEDISNISIATPLGKSIKLGAISSQERFYSPPKIERENKVRMLKVISAVSGTDLGTVKKILEQEIVKMDIPQEVTVDFGGSVDDMQKTFGDIMLLILLALILVYIVMAAQFESLTEPLIIMFSVPFAFSGVFISLYIFDTTINVISLIGAVMLVGIVVKNGIILVDYTNLLVDKGLSVRHAVISAGRSRLRPVLMTSLTMILAMIPMIFFSGTGSEMWRPMAVSIFGGLTFSTLVTLVLIPTVYTIFGVGTIKRTRKINRSKQETTNKNS